MSQTGAVSNQIRAVDWRHIALGAAALILAAIAYRTLFETSGSKPRKLALNLDQLMQAGQGNLANFFAFSFSLLGPFLFYIALLNSLTNNPIYLRFPSMPVVLLGYLGAVAVAYFVLTFRAYAHRSA